ncbi:hypothetical protein [Photobacterium salinisoli]|uniref:hypothetical protein n=1 Tax=Photobacterium salinisoli TaxID=1616783 RepID=UPI001F0977CD|nr:hypothetical protein [Photobacterium salinisoli]
MDRITSAPRRLSVEEIQELRRDMQESSAWAKAELKRRRAAKNQKTLRMVQMMVLIMTTLLTSCYGDVFSSY